MSGGAATLRVTRQRHDRMNASSYQPAGACAAPSGPRADSAILRGGPHDRSAVIDRISQR